MTFYSIDELAHAARAVLDGQRRVRRMAYAIPERTFDETVSMLEERLALYESGADVSLDEESGLLTRLATELGAARRVSLSVLAEDAAHVQDFGGLLAGRAADEQAVRGLDAPVDGVRVTMDAGRIMARLPMLPARRRTEMSHGGKRVVTESGIYAAGLRRVLDDMAGVTGNAAFARKTILYLFVYADIRGAIDNDNHETTAITNVLCGFLPGGDAAACCRFVYDSAQSDLVPPGTYVTVVPGGAEVPDADAVIGFWATELAGNPPLERSRADA